MTPEASEGCRVQTRFLLLLFQIIAFCLWVWRELYSLKRNDIGTTMTRQKPGKLAVCGGGVLGTFVLVHIIHYVGLYETVLYLKLKSTQ